MSLLPRLAVGTVQPLVDSQTIVWALLDALDQAGVRTQAFHSRACFVAHDGAAVITGQSSRHLDSWLMTESVCRQTFLRRTEGVEMAIVEGEFDIANPAGNGEERLGGSLDVLCEWLEMPRIAVVDCSQLVQCLVPRRPVADAILLDRVQNIGDRFRWQTVLESLWGIPVLGAMEEGAVLRRAVRELPVDRKPSRELCDELGRTFARGARLDELKRLACRRGLSNHWASDADERRFVPRGEVQVAVAYDEAFHCYFTETLDMLELRGAKVRVFSPLRDESLPMDTDLVYIGCGRPHEHAAALAENHCMLMALKEHVCSGKRIYAEGGGLAYLCQQIELVDGTAVPMVGALQAVARRNPVRLQPEPVEVILATDSWLGEAGTQLRGYRNRNWLVEPAGNINCLAAKSYNQLDLICRHQAIGSRLHLNFAAQPKLLGGFLRPCPAALAWART